MRAAVVNGIGQGFVIEDVDIAEPIGREVLVHVKAAGLCHTDLTIANHGLGYQMPSVLGHEVAGVVSAVGPDVTQIRVGDHVIGCLLQSCGMCTKCRMGKPYQCTDPHSTERSGGGRLTRAGEPLSQIFGLGGFAEQALIHENQLVSIPKSVPFPQAALIGCGVLTGAGAVLNTANVGTGETVVVIGAGGVGLNAVNGAAIAAAGKIIVIDIDDQKLAKSRRFGATHTVNSGATDPVAAVREITGTGADHVFDFVGIPSVYEQALAMLAVGGALFLVGTTDPLTAIQVPIVSAVLNQIRVQGVNFGSANFTRDIPVYLDLYGRGRMNLDDLVSREISLDELPAAHDMLNDPTVTRVVVTRFEK
ncbi:zinc-binding dehydrogenase [Mycobacterium sp.]|uniref:zinc-binding dehydrogenase n=1 Tax=Mycobacterium sp. TaxID=1785 RepID=UPI003BAF8B96